jgi:hypothetical protein
MIKTQDVLDTMDSHMMIGQVGHPDLPDGIDGGDTVNRMGHYGFLIWALRKVLKDKAEDVIGRIPYASHGRLYCDQVIGQFESKEYSGNYVRHFDPAQGRYGTVAHCKGDWDGVESRDQGTPVRIVLGAHKHYKRLGRALGANARRLMLFQNNTVGNGVDWRVAKRKIPDLTLFEQWALYIRGFWPYSFFLWPLLFVLDIETLLGSCIWRTRTEDPNKDDVINHCSVCIYGMLRMPTLTMWLACKINSRALMMQKLEHYWGKWRKSGYFVALYEPLVRQYFGR